MSIPALSVQDLVQMLVLWGIYQLAIKGTPIETFAFHELPFVGGLLFLAWLNLVSVPNQREP